MSAANSVAWAGNSTSALQAWESGNIGVSWGGAGGLGCLRRWGTVFWPVL